MPFRAAPPPELTEAESEIGINESRTLVDSRYIFRTNDFDLIDVLRHHTVDPRTSWHDGIAMR